MSNIIFPKSHPKGFCYVSTKYNLIYLPIPKNASTSIRNIKSLEFSRDLIFNWEDEINNDYKIFTVIRNPLERFISGYIETCERASADSLYILEKDFYWVLNQDKRLIYFLNELEDKFFDGHINPQSYYLYDFYGEKFDIDYYLLLENLNSQLEDIFNKMSIPEFSIPQKNVRNKNEKARLVKFIKFLYYWIKNIFNCSNITEYQINIQKFVYEFTSKIYKAIQRRPLPNKERIRTIISENKSIRERIDNLYSNDWKIYNKVKENKND